MLPRDSFISIDLKTKENFFFDFDAYSIVKWLSLKENTTNEADVSSIRLYRKFCIVEVGSFEHLLCIQHFLYSFSSATTGTLSGRCNFFILFYINVQDNGPFWAQKFQNAGSTLWSFLKFGTRKVAERCMGIILTVFFKKVLVWSKWVILDLKMLHHHISLKNWYVTFIFGM